MTFWILLVIAIVISILSFRWFNVLISVCAAVAWLILMGYNLDNPPAGIVQGSFIHQGMILIFVGMAIAILIAGIRNRNRNTESNYNGTAEEIAERNSINSRGVMDLSPNEYRAFIHSKTKNNRR